MPSDQENQPPSPWVQRCAKWVAPGGHVLDLACGRGRHARLFLSHGHPVTAVDRDLAGVVDLASDSRLTLVQADLESAPWPLAGQKFDAVVVCNYLHRPLMPRVIDSVAAGGMLIYTTFASGNARFGRPRNPDFLLQPNELLALVDDRFIVRAYEHGPVDLPRLAVRQSLCAVRRDCYALP